MIVGRFPAIWISMPVFILKIRCKERDLNSRTR